MSGEEPAMAAACANAETGIPLAPSAIPSTA